jgi:plastocyanin
MLRFRATLVAAAVGLAVAGVLGAACGGGDSTSTGTPGLPSANADASTSPAATIPAGAPEIDQSDLSYKPGTLTVAAGTTVYFKNSDSALHTVDVNSKNESGTMKKGAIFAWTPATAGTYKLTCDFLPQMNATITVQ